MSFQSEYYQLKFSMKSVNGVPLIALEGECDAFTAPAVHGAISSLIDAGHRNIIVNIEHLEFIDVAGFHALDECCIKMLGVGGKLLLVGPTKQVKEVYDILRERESCTMLKSVTEAKAMLVLPPT